MKRATKLHNTAPPPPETAERDAALLAKLLDDASAATGKKKSRALDMIAEHLAEGLLRDKERGGALGMIAQHVAMAELGYDKISLAFVFGEAKKISDKGFREEVLSILRPLLPKKPPHVKARAGTALRVVHKTESKPTVENPKETTYNPPVEHPPDIGGAPAEEWVTARVEKRRWEALKKEVAGGDASPAARALVETGMVACGRELTGKAAPVAEPATQEAKTEAQAFAVALEAMTLKERRAALIERYGLIPDKDGNYALPKKNQWKNVRGENPTPEKFRAWLDDVFPDRREIGLVLSDLKNLDGAAYEKLHVWSKKNSKTPKTVIDSFSLPSKRTSYDPTRDANAPKTFSEVVARAERGEGSFKNLSRSRARAHYHARVG